MKGSAISYEVSGEGIPVIVLHGLELDRKSMQQFLEPVFSELTGFKRIYFDLPGMGQSAAGKELRSTDDMLEITAAFIDDVIPDSPFLIAGLSYGGYLARGIASRMRKRVNGMLLVCPVIHPYATDRQLEQHAALRRDELFLAQLTAEDKQAFLRDMVVQTKDTYLRYRDEITAAVQVSDQNFVQGDFFKAYYGFSADPDEQAERFHKPVTIITGRQDAVTGYKDALALSLRYPNASFAVLDAAGHYVQIEQAETAEAMAKEWLRRCSEMHESERS